MAAPARRLPGLVLGSAVCFAALLLALFPTSSVAQTVCPAISGFNATANVYIPGNDLVPCSAMDLTTASAACNTNPDCKGFTLDVSGKACLKSRSGPLFPQTATCFYARRGNISVAQPPSAAKPGAPPKPSNISAAVNVTRVTAIAPPPPPPTAAKPGLPPKPSAPKPAAGVSACPAVPGYNVTANVYVPGNDLFPCKAMDRNAAAAACDSNPDCKAFQIDLNGNGCLKTVSAPTTTAAEPGTCFYVKQTAGAAATAGPPPLALTAKGPSPAKIAKPPTPAAAAAPPPKPAAAAAPPPAPAPAAANCPDINGYTASPNVYIPGNEIYPCKPMDRDSAASSCNSDFGCLAFSIDATGNGCMLNAASPTVPQTGTCLYIKW